MNPLIEEAVEALEAAGWRVERSDPPRPLPAAVVERHPELPPLLVEFATGLASCVDAEEGAWLLAAEDYARSGSDAFRWDEFERMTLDDDDDEHVGEARAFWDGYLPIFQLVSGDYEYLAIGTDPAARHFGKVVWGDVVDYENPLVIAESYEDFLVHLGDAARGPATQAALDGNFLVRLVHGDIADDGARWPGERLWRRLRGRLAGRP